MSLEDSFGGRGLRRRHFFIVIVRAIVSVIISIDVVVALFMLSCLLVHVLWLLLLVLVIECCVFDFSVNLCFMSLSFAVYLFDHLLACVFACLFVWLLLLQHTTFFLVFNTQHFKQNHNIYNSVLNHTYYRSTSPPGGNQVDGLPPALRTVRIRPMESMAWAHFR